MVTFYTDALDALNAGTLAIMLADLLEAYLDPVDGIVVFGNEFQKADCDTVYSAGCRKVGVEEFENAVEGEIARRHMESAGHAGGGSDC